MYASDEVRDNREPHTAIACAGSGGTGGGSQDCVRVRRNEPRREKRELVVRDIVEPVRENVFRVSENVFRVVSENEVRVVPENEVRVGRDSSRAGRGVPSGMDLREGRGAGSRGGLGASLVGWGASLVGLGASLVGLGASLVGWGASLSVDVDSGTDADGGPDSNVAGRGGRGVDSESGGRNSERGVFDTADDGVDECIAGFVEDKAGSVCDLGSPGRRVDLER
ncbi:hypothetical protein EV122DRAFT_292780 [Schizophyllum commune]